MRDLAALRVLLVHDWLYTWGGAERCLEEMLTFMPHADLVAGIVTPETRARQPIIDRARETWVGRIPGARVKHRWFLPLHALAFSGLDTTGYDLVVSLSHGFSKAIRPHGRTVHVCYCFSPPRYLWDLQDTYAAFASPAQRAALSGGASLMRQLDRRAARGVHHFIAISEHVAERVRRCYDRESDVVYPPVRAKTELRRGARAPEPFLLSLGRLVSYKRVDLAISAAERLGIRLIVAGDGPERARLEQLAGPNTTFVGEISDQQAGQLLSTCAAFVFCAEEDFGIAPLEANAHGAPVVAYGRGASTETMQDGISAVLFDRQDVAAVAAAIQRCLSTKWDDRSLRANAHRFNPGVFQSGLVASLQKALDRS